MAAAPKIESNASHAMHASQLMPPGRTMLLPKGRRARGSCAMPVFGPIVASKPTTEDPIRLPRMMASSPVVKPSCKKSAAASVPTKKAGGRTIAT